MGLFSLFRNGKRTPKNSRKRSSLQVERLEDRTLPSGNTISGFVFHDVNNNGLFDPGEQPIANTQIELRNAQNVVVGTTTTDANGFYQFQNDNTVQSTPLTLTKTLSFPNTPTNFSLQGAIDQFDPSLGQLQSVKVTQNGAITSQIGVENTSTSSGSTIAATVSGNITLTGPAGLSLAVNLQDNVGSFQAGTFDSNIDFGGASGHTFDPDTVSGTKSVTLTGADMSAFIGTGQVSLTETANAASQASGGGNVVVSLNASGASGVTVIYTYVPQNSLKPGDYTILETQPQGFLDGQESSGGAVLNHPIGTDFIKVTLGNTDVPNNNFGEVKASSLAGFVYLDANNNGIRDAGETPINNVTVTLTGTDDLGAVSKTATTDASGAYQFLNLRPGAYTLTETQPANYLDGKDTIGSQGGTVGNDTFTNITIPSGTQGVNNNFGELTATGLSGFVYVDSNNNGIKDPGENGINGVTVTLSGTDDQGPVNKTATTDASGAYQFASLRPGSYALTETQPAGYIDGKDTIGSQGGVVGNDQFTGITLLAGAAGINNNFGELTGSSLAGNVFADVNNNGIKDGPESGIANVTVTLTGSDDLGSVNKTTTTDAAGAYQFLNLRPGTYAISETQPANYLDGKDTIGTQGGTAGNDQFTAINLPGGAQGINNNFGELTPAGVAGFVYSDANNNGIKEAGEAGIANVTVALTGTDDLGSVTKTTKTDANGAYDFDQLRPGTYTVTETQPTGYNDGKDTIGSAGGTVSNDQFTAIVLATGVLATDYDFGEILPQNADIGIVKAANPGSVLVGGTFTYTLTITNHGNDPAKDVLVTDNLPPNVTLLNATGLGWTFALPSTSGPGGTFSASLPTLAVGASSVITVTVKAPILPGLVTNAADVTSTTPDNNPTNNHSEVTTLVYNQPGQTFPQAVTPLVTQFGVPVPTIKKINLFNDTITTTAAAADPALRPNLAFVDGLFRSLLGRPADYATQVQLAQQLQSGVLTRDQLVSNFWFSDTHRAIQAAGFFQTFYHRNGTPGEIQAVVNQFRSGMSETDVALSFLTSPEYAAAHPGAGGFLAGFYADVVGAVPDLSTQLVFLQSVSTMSTNTLAQTMLFQTDSVQRLVDNSYLAVLRRHASASELQSWTGQIQGGLVNLGDLMRNLLASSEFLNIAATNATLYSV